MWCGYIPTSRPDSFHNSDLQVCIWCTPCTNVCTSHFSLFPEPLCEMDRFVHQVGTSQFSLVPEPFCLDIIKYLGQNICIYICIGVLYHNLSFSFTPLLLPFQAIDRIKVHIMWISEYHIVVQCFALASLQFQHTISPVSVYTWLQLISNLTELDFHLTDLNWFYLSLAWFWLDDVI